MSGLILDEYDSVNGCTIDSITTDGEHIKFNLSSGRKIVAPSSEVTLE